MNWFQLRKSGNKPSSATSHFDHRPTRRRKVDVELGYGSKKQKDKEYEADLEAWTLTYSDTVTLLLTFFVLMFAISDVSQQKFEEMKAALSGGLLKKEQPMPFKEMKEKLDKIIVDRNLQEQVAVEEDPLGIRIELASSSLYGSGSAQIKQDIIPTLGEVVYSIRELEFSNYLIEVEGHTDDVPISSGRYDSNWELSAHRATNVVRFFINEGIDAQKLKASGFGESRPKKPNRNVDGTPIPDNQAANRRVVIYIRRNV